MPETPKKFYLTTPIYYVNARPHIGHAYSTIAADVIARRHRLLGEDVFFLTGTDEHGQKVQRSAAAAGIPPQQFTDEVSASFSNLWKRMGITNDDFIRTTDPRHKRGVQKLWQDLEARGAIYLSTYTGQYSVGEEMFIDGPPGTLGPDGKPTETITEENYFFKLSEYQEQLINLIESDNPEDPLRIQPVSVRNEVLSFLRGIQTTAVQEYLAGALNEGFDLRGAYSKKELKDAVVVTGRLKGDVRLSSKGNPYLPGALKDLSISRTTFDWGIKVPDNPKHVVYVWLDALVNYLTAIGYGSDDPADIAKFEKYWPADLHLVGKEITRFHCVYWPAFLLAAGLPLPKSVVANGWLLFEESKMSKSRGNVVRTETILEAFGENVYATQFPESTKHERDLFAADVLRYYLLHEIPFGQDGSFSFDALITRYNADLANGYGNLVSRTLAMVSTNFAGYIPTYPYDPPSEPKSLPLTLLFEGKANNTDFFSLLKDILGFIGVVDGKITSEAPWKLAKSSLPEDREKLSSSLYRACEAIRVITAYLYPIIPYSTARVWAQLGLGDIEEAAENGYLKKENLQWGGLKPGTRLGLLSPIFPRADKGLAQIMTDLESPTPTEPATPAPTQEKSVESVSSVLSLSPEEAKETPISIDDFTKIDLRVAQIVLAERIPKADKLLRLEVDLGPDHPHRQILSGIAEWYTPEELIGRRVAIIANLAPRKMRGLESHGMLLAASADAPASKPILATFSDEVPLGSRIR
jgi:methionyl-tRNA synthetase